MKSIEIYTDGSCLNNPGFGGWAYILSYKDHKKENSGACENTTNNRMELMAIIQALKALKEPCDIKLYTDSKLMVQSINEWLKEWIRKDFKNKKNTDLWQEYLAISKIHKIVAIWIKAHNGHEFNERCDMLARDAALELQKERSKNV
ncbi:ribonuclease HI [Campylobacter insulaenigrae]|uniref:ribonuclease HI n=1 Tax=Campylobacter insulaenigrae TaxID=260714 RepID=UPI00215372A8|nr:ribonuclease HI [Campylobacter insulaenigrae]MCR6594292.1 ribonuclease HI [Campylobacter insulaenigrae]